MGPDRGLVERLRLGIPSISGRTLGIYRLFFGTALLTALVTDDILFDGAVPPAFQTGFSPLAQTQAIQAFAANPAAILTTDVVTAAALVLFSVGLFTRWMYVVAVCGFALKVHVILQYRGVHDLGLPLVTLALLSLVPWGDGFSIDAWPGANA